MAVCLGLSPNTDEADSLPRILNMLKDERFFWKDPNGDQYKLVAIETKKGDAACHGCAFMNHNQMGRATENCKNSPTCTPNNRGIVKPEWVGKQVVWVLDNQL